MQPRAIVRTVRTLSLALLSLGLLAGCGTESPTPAVPARLTNSGFELPLDSGWVSAVVNDSNTQGFIERSDTLGQPDSGFAVRLYKHHRQHVSLSQTVPLQTIEQTAEFKARFRYGGSVECAPVAAVVFNYLDSLNHRLGRTLICLASEYAQLTDSDSLHIIPVSDTAGGHWTQYRLDLLSDLTTGLPDVDRDQVKYLTVEITAWVETSG